MSATQSPDELEMILGKVYSSDSLGDEFNEYEKHELKAALLAWRDIHTREAVLQASFNQLGPIHMMVQRPANHDDMDTMHQTIWAVIQLGHIGSYCDKRKSELDEQEAALKPADDKETKQ